VKDAVRNLLQITEMASTLKKGCTALRYAAFAPDSVPRGPLRYIPLRTRLYIAPCCGENEPDNMPEGAARRRLRCERSFRRANTINNMHSPDGANVRHMEPIRLCIIAYTTIELLSTIAFYPHFCSYNALNDVLSSAVLVM